MMKTLLILISVTSYNIFAAEEVRIVNRHQVELCYNLSNIPEVCQVERAEFQEIETVESAEEFRRISRNLSNCVKQFKLSCLDNLNSYEDL